MPHRGFAQGSVTATLSGTVFDSSKAVVPGARITAKNQGTASVTTAISDAEGLFTIPALEPGNYSVTIAMKGFATTTLEDIRLNAGVPANVKPVLTPGGVAESVVVEAAEQAGALAKRHEQRVLFARVVETGGKDAQERHEPRPVGAEGCRRRGQEDNQRDEAGRDSARLTPSPRFC